MLKPILSSFFAKVRFMRTLQKNYFKNKSFKTLQKCKAVETQVRQIIYNKYERGEHVAIDKFVSLITNMLELQAKYYQSRSQIDLLNAINAEKILDNYINKNKKEEPKQLNLYEST